MINSLLSLLVASNLNVNFETLTSHKSPNYLANNLIENSINSADQPIKDSLMISPVIGAKSSIAMDLNSGTILYEKKPHRELAIASITKLMTMLIILEENKPDELVTVSSNAAKTEGSTMFLRAGEKITVENLLYGALINSANDSAVALAEYNAGSVAKFIQKMNQKAKDLELNNTHFSNPIGLDDRNNYSSAYDIAKLGSYLYKNEFIKKAAKIKNMQVRSKSGNFTHKLESTNELLNSHLKINGLKTGKTDAAGLCLVAIAENDQGREIITVVLGSPDRFQESKVLIDWVFRAYKWPGTSDIASAK